MNSHARDSRPADRAAHAQLRPPPKDAMLRSPVPMALVSIGLVVGGIHAGNPGFGLAAALSLALLARAQRRLEERRSSAPGSRR